MPQQKIKFKISLNFAIYDYICHHIWYKRILVVLMWILYTNNIYVLSLPWISALYFLPLNLALVPHYYHCPSITSLTSNFNTIVHQYYPSPSILSLLLNFIHTTNITLVLQSYPNWSILFLTLNCFLNLNLISGPQSYPFPLVFSFCLNHVYVTNWGPRLQDKMLAEWRMIVIIVWFIKARTIIVLNIEKG